MASQLDAEAVKVAQFGSDLDALEQALGHSHIEMYIRQLKMELRCARSLADDQVRISVFRTVRFKNFRVENFRYFWNSRFVPRCENFRGFRYFEVSLGI